ncbi:dTDP-4-dehydrorhamnose 3,5-epimerase [Methanococcus maripaludis]|uniref:dTDP-4-dehydrorhamnose 3,5-epimerase n=1 Tax=Methanococcus maripaludis TaxID=39152 RepID=A0A7J9P0P5_METMI|nr:dTDP-4-dehydrorhamnose 3,5-epimerase [Methanococcus maripaludis]MBA2853117.1 dTDP-4-dehydrorhamnose 3,5-epimerase [Methanococcus maripaludis]
MPFIFKNLEIPEVILVEPKVFPDERGFFFESYKFSDFFDAGITENFVQDNHSKSKYMVLRGLHFQKNPKAQGKLVRCITGEIFDVAVDLRKNSPNYGKWVGEILSEENKKMLYIPKGFAHGFCVLSSEAEIIYKCTEEYSPEFDAGIFWNDESIRVNWPVENPIISEKDSKLPNLKDSDINFVCGE